MRCARPTLWAVALTVAFTANTQAQDLHMELCPLDQAVRLIQNYWFEFSDKIADQKLPLLRDIEQLNEKGFAHPDRPLRESLTLAELAKLQELRFQVLRLDANRKPVATYLRDVRAIAKLREVAYASSQGHDYAESDPDYFYSTILTLLRKTSRQDAFEHPTFPANASECTVETGLHFYEQLMLREIKESKTFGPATQRIGAISHKYKLDIQQDGWIERIPSEKERKTARTDIGTLEQVFTMHQYVIDIENLKLLDAVMLLLYQSTMDDLRRSHTEAQLRNLGLSFDEKIRQLDDRTQQLAVIQAMIAAKIPSETLIETEGTSKRVGEQGVIK